MAKRKLFRDSLCRQENLQRSAQIPERSESVLRDNRHTGAVYDSPAATRHRKSTNGWECSPNNRIKNVKTNSGSSIFQFGSL